MKNTVIYIIGILVMMLGFGCEDVIELNVPEGDKRMVVEGLLTNEDTTHFIKLTTTNKYFDASNTPRISGALVFLATNEPDTVYYYEKEIGSGMYLADYSAKENVEYVLHIHLPNGKKYISFAERLNRVSKIDTIIQNDEFLDSTNYRKEGYYVSLSTYEPEGIGDYYRWITYINNEKLLGPEYLAITSDELVDGQDVSDINRIYGLLPGDVVEFQQMSISSRAFHFWSLLQNQISNFGSPFDTPPTPIEGNIRNVTDESEEVFGLFGISKVERKKYTVVHR